MLGPHGSVGSCHGGLDVAQDRVAPFEARIFGRQGSAARFDRGMGATCFLHGGKAVEGIGDDVNACGQRVAPKFGDGLLAEADNAAKGNLIDQTLLV